MSANVEIYAYSAPWCGECRRLKDVFKNNNITVIDISLKENEDLPKQINIQTLPTLIKLIGDVECKRMVKNFNNKTVSEFVKTD